jgi:hypothetical protein
MENNEFRRIHLIQAAMQGLGRSMDEITLFLAWVESLCGAEQFAEFNQLLTEDETIALCDLLEPDERELCERTMQDFFRILRDRFGISDADFAALGGWN